MVVKIKEWHNIGDKVHYNSKKVQKREAEFSYTNLLSTEPYEVEEIMSKVAAQNNRVEKKYMTGIISFSSEEAEKLTANKRADLVKELLDGVKMGNVPVMSWEHRDTNNVHIHFLSTKVDFDGKKIKDSFLKLKISEVARQLEEKYDLSRDHAKKQHKINKKGKDRSLNEQNYSLYKMHRALKTMHARGYNFSVFTEVENIKGILESKKDLKVEEIEKNLNKNLFQALEAASKRWEKRSYKQDLQAQLHEIRKSSSSLEEYKSKMDEKGVYHYAFYDNKKQIIKYGYKEHSVYFGEERLAEKYGLGALKQYFSYKPQLQNLEQEIKVVLSNSDSYSDFTSALEKRGLKLQSNGRSVFFQVGTNKIEESDLNFSLSKTKEVFAQKAMKGELQHRLQEFDGRSFSEVKKEIENCGYKVNYARNEQGKITDLIVKNENVLWRASDLGVRIEKMERELPNYFNDEDFSRSSRFVANQFYAQELDESDEEKRKKKKKRDLDA